MSEAKPFKESKAQQRSERLLAYSNENGQWLSEMQMAPTFRPTSEEFKDPMLYIQSIQAQACKFGICKIVPPCMPAILPAVTVKGPDGQRLKFSTRHQTVQKQAWKTFEATQFYQSGRSYNLGEFEKMANTFQRNQLGSCANLPPQVVEAAYWCQFEEGRAIHVEYGNDVEGTAFAPIHSKDPLGSTKWNLQVLPTVDTSCLRLMGINIPGVTSPMLYVGMLFATFAWHVEDHNLYSINYQHMGAAKTWYGVPARGADGFDDVVVDDVYRNAMQSEMAGGASRPEALNKAHHTLLAKTTVFSPEALMKKGVPVYRVVQSPGEYVVTFPRSYHGGFSNGFCVGEAVNFAFGDWFQYGLDSCLRYSRLKRAPMLDQEQLLVIEAQQLTKDDPTLKKALTHVNASVLPQFVKFLSAQKKLLQMAKSLGADVKVAKDPAFRGEPCQECEHICYLLQVKTRGKLQRCVRCAIQKGKSLKGSSVLCHSTFAELEKLAALAKSISFRGPPKSLSLDLTGLTEARNSGNLTLTCGDSGENLSSDDSVVDPDGRSIATAQNIQAPQQSSLIAPLANKPKSKQPESKLKPMPSKRSCQDMAVTEEAPTEEDAGDPDWDMEGESDDPEGVSKSVPPEASESGVKAWLAIDTAVHHPRVLRSEKKALRSEKSVPSQRPAKRLKTARGAPGASPEPEQSLPELPLGVPLNQGIELIAETPEGSLSNAPRTAPQQLPSPQRLPSGHGQSILPEEANLQAPRADVCPFREPTPAPRRLSSRLRRSTFPEEPRPQASAPDCEAANIMPARDPTPPLSPPKPSPHHSPLVQPVLPQFFPTIRSIEAPWRTTSRQGQHLPCNDNAQQDNQSIFQSPRNHAQLRALQHSSGVADFWARQNPGAMPGEANSPRHAPGRPLPLDSHMAAMHSTANTPHFVPCGQTVPKYSPPRSPAPSHMSGGSPHQAMPIHRQQPGSTVGMQYPSAGRDSFANIPAQVHAWMQSSQDRSLSQPRAQSQQGPPHQDPNGSSLRPRVSHSLPQPLDRHPTEDVPARQASSQPPSRQLPQIRIQAQPSNSASMVVPQLPRAWSNQPLQAGTSSLNPLVQAASPRASSGQSPRSPRSPTLNPLVNSSFRAQDLSALRQPRPAQSTPGRMQEDEDIGKSSADTPRPKRARSMCMAPGIQPSTVPKEPLDPSNECASKLPADVEFSQPQAKKSRLDSSEATPEMPQMQNSGGSAQPAQTAEECEGQSQQPSTLAGTKSEEPDWLVGLDLAGTDFSRAASTRNGSIGKLLARHAMAVNNKAAPRKRRGGKRNPPKRGCRKS